MKKIKWHIIGVLVYSIYVLTLDVIYYKKFYYASELTALLAQMWIFYSGYSILYFAFLSPKKNKFFILITLPISLIGAYFTVLSNYVVNLYYFKTAFTTKIVIYDTSQVYTHFFIYALGYFFVERFIKKQKQLRLAEQQQAEAEKEKLALEINNLRLQDDLLQSENNFLRAQINPHFLYNCLNFFYSETMENNPNVSDGILILADIMRYSLKDYSATNGLAHLSEEITHIENVITIHQLRFVGTLNIQFTVEGNLENKLIAPMVLITMVENVFKHGNLNDDNNPALLACKIDCYNNMIYFTTENKKKTGTKEQSTGIGLENIKQRLRSLYNDNFNITTSETNDVYKKEITIPYFDPGYQTQNVVTTVMATTDI